MTDIGYIICFLGSRVALFCKNEDKVVLSSLDMISFTLQNIPAPQLLIQIQILSCSDFHFPKLFCEYLLNLPVYVNLPFLSRIVEDAIFLQSTVICTSITQI